MASLQGAKLFELWGKVSSNHCEVGRTVWCASWTMSSEPKPAHMKKTEGLSLPVGHPPAPQFNRQRSLGLSFNRLKPPEKDLVQKERHEFGQFIAREALLNEEYWTAAWLRAESHWEDRPNERYVENYKRKFAEQEFSAIKRRCARQNAQKCTCIVTVKKDQGNEKHTVLKSIVGTLDLSIRYLLNGETFPGERLRVPPFFRISNTGPSRYAYIANLCVAKSARRQGIASNMLNFALKSAKTIGVEIAYVHVHRNNKAAQLMYAKMGFQVVDEATVQLTEEQIYLLSLEI
ncbi:hypothetical protein SAY86_009617 [Trapa natans]|uniref:N-acetyltransferase domain-containing protein n=1 Tax=Trapa natans TaxID=22666 RepID=A0AAN7L555_TRANT|nr:hypothetical protein SAY86_009617 [Trapa natans]